MKAYVTLAGQSICVDLDKIVASLAPNDSGELEVVEDYRAPVSLIKLGYSSELYGLVDPRNSTDPRHWEVVGIIAARTNEDFLRLHPLKQEEKFSTRHYLMCPVRAVWRVH